MPYKDKERRRKWEKAYRKSNKNKINSLIYSYQKIDLNSFGVKKHNIRLSSSRFLFKTLKHTKLKGYEIHHCFSYDNYKTFIYISHELHMKIHQFLRDNEIDADSNHYAQIAHLINEWDGYTYIKV